MKQLATNNAGSGVTLAVMWWMLRDIRQQLRDMKPSLDKIPVLHDRSETIKADHQKLRDEFVADKQSWTNQLVAIWKHIGNRPGEKGEMKT